MEEGKDNAEIPESPVDKKRIALLNGACGKSDWLLITGQVVDVPVTASQRDEDWDPYLNLPISLRGKIRPIQDFGMTAVRRPRLQMEILRGAYTSPNEMEIVHASEVFKADDSSFFSHELGIHLPPGEYTIRIILRGIDSLRQSVADLSYIGDSNSLILKHDVPIGHGRLLVLPDDYQGLIVTSDIDQTFLDTKIESNQGLMETLFETPDMKRPIPGMEEFYRQLTCPLFFISASPHFFRRSLGAVFALHGIPYRGLNLKYLMGTLEMMFRKSIASLLNLEELFSGGIGMAVERSMKFLGSSIQSLFDQVSYKLATLLENRLMQPTGAREILIGDNTESDYLIFTLYQYILSGLISGNELETYLYKLNFLNREAITRDASRRIRQLADANLERHGRVNPVTHIWINQAAQANSQTSMAESLKNSLPVNVMESAHGTIQEFRLCQGAVGIGLAALEAGLIDLESMRKIWKYAEGAPLRDGTLDREFLRKLAGDARFQDLSGDALVAAIAS